jgi:predicted HTH transcriptional regulator
VQKELAAERRAVAEHVRADPLLKRFLDVFLFEELPPKDRRADALYIEQVDQASVYLGIFGNDYGFEDAAGLSPTEREFDRATARGIPRLIFVKGDDDAGRHPKMTALIRKAAAQVIRRRFGSTDELLRLLQDSLVDHLESRGAIQDRACEERPCADATLGDIDADAVARFVRRARSERQFPLPEQTPVADVLTHLNLLRGAQSTMAAILLFGRDPQRFVPAGEVRCMHFHGTAVERPAPSYQVFKGNLFEQVDRGADFVLSVLNRRVGTRALSAQAPVSYEIPPDVVREAIVNAVAHRDYASGAAVQVSVFSDRVEVWNPGALPPGLTPARLREPHGSVARNPRICEALFLTRYIEKYGTGTLMMIRESVAHGLPEPRFEQRGGELVVTVWRDWLTEQRLAKLGLNERQKNALLELRTAERITNADYQRVSGAARKTATRDLADLVDRGILERIGLRKAAHYVLRKQ